MLGSGVFGQLNEKLHQLQNECFSSQTPILSFIKDMLNEEDKDLSTYRQALEEINENLNNTESRDLMKAKCDTLMLKIMVIQVSTMYLSSKYVSSFQRTESFFRAYTNGE